MNKKVKVGLVGLSLESHLSGIPGLRERMEGYVSYAARKLSIPGVKVVSLGLVDHPDKARRAGDFLLGEQVEAVCVFFASGGEHHALIAALARPKVPVLVLNLQPAPALDYRLLNGSADAGRIQSERLSFSQVRSLAKAASVLNQSGITYHIVSGWLEDDQAWDEIIRWERVIKARSQLRDTRIGLLGFWDCPEHASAELRAAAAKLAVQFELIDHREIERNRQMVKSDELEKKLEQLRRLGMDPAGREETAEISCALDRGAAEHKLDLLVGCGNTALSWKEAVLAKPHISLIWEGGIPGAISSRIVSLLGAYAHQAVMQSVDYTEETLLWAQQPGRSIASGHVTCIGFFLDMGNTPEVVVAQGNASSKEVHGYDYPELRIRYDLPVKDVITEWSRSGAGDHCVLGAGCHAASIQQLCDVLQISCRIIC